jgi:hypothetical protein
MMLITSRQLKQIIKEELLREQQEPEEGLSDDGKSFTAKFKLGSDMQAAMEHADLLAREGAVENNILNPEAISRTQAGGFIFSTWGSSVK